MAAASAVQLIRIARLRRFVGVFARGGDREATADALTELARADRAGGLTSDALRRARQAAQLLADEETGEAGVRALLHLGSVCLDTGAPDAAASAAELARARASELADPIRSELVAAAALLGGIAHAIDGRGDEARTSLSEARELLIAARQPAGAALALLQQGLLDLASDRVDGGELCFAFARDLYRAAQLPVAAVEVAAVAARAFADAEKWTNAERWFVTAIGEADLIGATRLAAELVIDQAAELERAGQPGDAMRVASDAARRCTLLGEDQPSAELKASVRLQLGRLTEDPRLALHHLEAAFELSLPRRDVAGLGGALDVLVSGIVRERLPASAWRLVERFRDRLTSAGFAALAETADAALADLRR